MKLNPNDAKAVFPTIYRLWEKVKDKEDYEYSVTEIAVITGIHLATVSIALYDKYPEQRFADLRDKFTKIYKITEVVPLEKTNVGDVLDKNENV